MARVPRGIRGLYDLPQCSICDESRVYKMVFHQWTEPLEIFGEVRGYMTHYGLKHYCHECFCEYGGQDD